MTQCESLRLPFVEASDFEQRDLQDFDVVIDALFGFSFSGAPRPPFDAILQKLANGVSKCLLASVDIPSGWHVEKGPNSKDSLRPDLLVSLTAPKLSAKHFNVRPCISYSVRVHTEMSEAECDSQIDMSSSGRSLAHITLAAQRVAAVQGIHYLGGRFVPPEIAQQFNLRLPPYPGTAMCVKISGQDKRSQNIADMRLSDSDLSGGLTEDSVLRVRTLSDLQTGCVRSVHLPSILAGPWRHVQTLAA